MNIDPNHPFTLHKTYTGKGCAMCGKEESEHSQKSIQPENKIISKEATAGDSPTRKEKP